MKLHLLPMCAILAAGTLPSVAQSETKPGTAEPESADTPTTNEDIDTEIRTSTGITFSIGEDELLITPENVKIPLMFTRASVTPLVDENEKPVTWDQMKSGIPVTVEYTLLGEKMMATKVTVTRYMVAGGKPTAPVDEAGKKRVELAEAKQRRVAESAEREKTLPTTGSGTIMGFEQVIAVGTGNGGDVTQYVVNNSTQYLDLSGKPIALNLVRTGSVVDINFVEHSGRKIATRLIFHRVNAQEGLASGTGPAASGNGQNSATGTTTTGNQAGGGTAAWLDQNGNVITGALENGFINPPVTVLPGATVPGGTAGNPAGTQPAPGTTNPNGTPVTGNNPLQPGPPNVQPGTPTQPGSTPQQPGTRQPGTRPATPSAPGTGSPSTPAAPAPAPGGR
jgi:hypothetical protein